MKLQYDEEVDVLYLDLEHEDAEVEDTLDFADGVFLDVDEESVILGIEFISSEAFRRFVQERELPTDIMAWLNGEALRILFHPEPSIGREIGKVHATSLVAGSKEHDTDNAEEQRARR